MKFLSFGVAIVLSLTAAAPAAELPSDDPYLWLEEVDGAKPLDWVRAHNAVSQKELEGLPEFKPIHERLLKILESDARIPYVEKLGAHYYNFWRDAKQVRGIWRLDVRLDIDALPS